MRANPLVGLAAEEIVTFDFVHTRQQRVHFLHEGLLVAGTGGPFVKAVVSGDAAVGGGPDPGAKFGMMGIAIGPREQHEDDGKQGESRTSRNDEPSSSPSCPGC